MSKPRLPDILNFEGQHNKIVRPLIISGKFVEVYLHEKGKNYADFIS
jgi:hypothetical protein